MSKWGPVSARKLAQAAAYADMNPRDMMVSTYDKKIPTYVEILSGGETSMTELISRNFFYNAGTETYYCFITKTMYERGVELPQERQTLDLKIPVEVLEKGVIDAPVRHQIYVARIEINNNCRVAKIKTT